MATKESSGSSGAVAEAREKGAELVSAAQDQVGTKAGELRGEAEHQIREQIDQRSTQMGEEVQSFGHALSTGAQQLRSEGKATSARAAEQAAQRVDDIGRYLQGANADRILGDVEDFARRRPWLTAGAAAFVGFAASRFLKASSDRRYQVAHGAGRPTTYPAQRTLPTGGVE